MATAGICGGAAGLVLGGLVHGRGWLGVALLVLVAGISALMTAAGATAAITGLQLLVYTILGTGPLGALRPWWWAPLQPTGWSLALDRLIDTALGCVIVLLVGSPPGPRAGMHTCRNSWPSRSIVWRVTRSRRYSASRAGRRCAAGPTEPYPTCARSFSGRWQSPPR